MCNLLYHQQINLSEPMVFGLAQGLGFIYWNMKIMDFPFIGGRIKQDALTQILCNNLELKLNTFQTSSIKKAWAYARATIDSGQPVGLKLDCYYLDYFKSKIHFAAHYVAMYGYDATSAYVVDTRLQGTTHKIPLKSLELARNARGPMSSSNLSFSIGKTKPLPSLQPLILKSIRANAKDFLNPPIQNIGYKGILKMSREVLKWFDISNNPKYHLTLTADLMEYGGTGGALFRNYYRDFLAEAFDITGKKNIKTAQSLFSESASLWTQSALLIKKAGKCQDFSLLTKLSGLFKEISGLEKGAMGLLLNI